MLPSELLSKPEAWTKGALARDANGRAVEWNDPAACRWCSLGSLYKCFGDDPKSFGNYEKRRALAEAIGIARVSELPAWNDDKNRTHAEVVAALRKAGL